MQSDNEFIAVIKLFHQLELLFKVHRGRTSHHTSWFGTESKFFRHKTSGIENQIGTFKELSSANRNEIGVAWASANNLDMSAS